MWYYDYMKIIGFIKNNIALVILAAIFVFALAIRIFPSWNIVFSDPIKYTADDGIYHMRLVENMLLGGHFPFRIYFDPYTNFPHGTYIHFTPLYDWILAFVVWIFSFGKPTIESINLVSPFVPAAMGALVVFLVYFLTKALFKNKAMALLAAFLSGTSGAFLYRSVLGNTDHHVAEVFFSTLAMLFFVFALQAGKEKRSKKLWILSALAGLSFGLYFLAWTGAVMFLFLIFCFLVLYYLIEYFLGSRQNWILQLGIIIFAVSFLMIIPFLGHPDLFHTYMYNIVHLAAFGLGFLAFIALFLLDKFFLKKNISRKLMPVFFALAIVCLLFLIKIFFPTLFDSFISGAKEINTGMSPSALARELTGEMQPVRYIGLINNFQMVFVVAMAGIAALIYFFAASRAKNPEYLLLALWAVFMISMAGILPMFGQVRFVYYLAIIFSIIFSFVVIGMAKFGWQAIQESKGMPKENIYKKYVSLGGASIVLAAFYFLVYPFPFNLETSFPNGLPHILQATVFNSKLTISDQDRYDVCDWLKNNTPDPGLDYYELYKEPGLADYKYPDSAYGILAVWDFGHMITYYGHRIPVANPFHQGNGRKNADGTITPGYATFFLAEDEKTATGYLDELRVKYVIADSGSANADGVYQQLIKWQQDGFDGYLAEDGKSINMARYYNSMIAKLALFDGKQASFDDYNIAALSHFRLVYESENTGFTLKIDDNKEVKRYKIFEYVRGAVIKGRAQNGSNVEISIGVKTNQERNFTYKNSFKASNGQFEFTVPYEGRYTIKIGNYSKEIEVSEQDVTTGSIIKFN